MRDNTVIDDYAEFDVTFEKYEESKNELKAEIKKMIKNNYSKEEINKVLDNGIHALMLMAFGLEQNELDIVSIDIRTLYKTTEMLINTRQHVK